MGRWRWFYGADASRRAQLEKAWADPATDAVLCMAGGWGSARILEAAVGALPPVLSGSWGSPMPVRCSWPRSGAVAAEWYTPVRAEDAAQWQRLVSLLRVEPLSPLIGTPWFPSLVGCVLLLEDVGEAPYRVDRMLTQWRSAGLFQPVAR